MSLHWYQTNTVTSKSYTCGHCGNSLASNVAYQGSAQSDGGGTANRYVYICHHCFKPTYFSSDNEQVPGPRPGEDVEGIDDSGVESLYKEARDTYSKNAFTATILCCRKLLMHVAVSKGAKEGDTFIAYVEYLSANNFVPPGAKEWVDQIRKKGNEANHEIVIMTKEAADDLLSFVTILLKLVYEFPNKMKGKESEE
jgi:DNA-directed RNA polymerase subunit RPC12/RpoP